MDWEIMFLYDKNLDLVFIHKFFYFLVSRGVKYNAGKFKGHYSIFTEQPEKDIYFEENEIKESTEKLAEIIDAYAKFDLKRVPLSIWLDYLNEANFSFGVSILPGKGNNSLVTFEVGEHVIPDEKTFLSFVNLCKEVFVRFNFVYGIFRSEYQYSFPHNKEDFLKGKPDIVNFYSKPIVDEIGREKLLSAPAFKVEELENGGVMLIVCTEPLGCENIYDVWHHLGYK